MTRWTFRKDVKGLLNVCKKNNEDILHNDKTVKKYSQFAQLCKTHYFNFFKKIKKTTKKQQHYFKYQIVY